MPFLPLHFLQKQWAGMGKGFLALQVSEVRVRPNLTI